MLRHPQPLHRRELMTSAGALALSACATSAATTGQAHAPAAPSPGGSAGAPALPGRTPNTRIAVNIEMWWKGPAEDRIRAAAALGFPAVEFWPYQNKNLDAMVTALREHDMKAAQFTAWGFGKELNHPEADTQKFLAAIEESCAVADRLPGCEMFTVVAGDDIDGLSKETMHRAVIEKLRAAVPLLEKNKKMIILEPMNPYNHPAHCLYGSKDGVSICEAVGSEWVKLNWDLFHMQRFEGNLIANLRNGKAHIGYVQLADSPARHEPGTGEVNYTEVLKAVKEIGYTGFVGAECVPADMNQRRAAERLYAADSW